ncbi:MAG TPA: alcohol dehydrogenase catalytic domain-containing protein [Phycisphaerae bacterium]|nr:alcohol dehydrogenase catalytic domain-containing protein [Phycisphaerae bacterium]HRR84783.1 alcohol dehydrogenase catalytic domain-containing protein [Phycisphaerae bacterium]
MKAARLTGPNQIEYLDVPQPVCADDEVLVQVKCVGVCGTDAEMYRGTMAYFKMGWTQYPITLGHEWSGVVVERGRKVTEFSVGDRVTGDVTIGCHRCENCLRGSYNLCLSKIEVGLCRGKDGAYAEYLTMPARHTFRVPDTVSFEEAAMTEPAATVVKAIRKAPFEPGAVCVILGDGPIGLLGLQAAEACGAGKLVLTGTVDAKLQLGHELGADVVVNVRRQDLQEVIEDLTGGVGADYVMEASGSVEAMQQAVAIARMGGIVSVVGLPEIPVPEFDMGNVAVRDLNIITSVASPNVFPQTLRLMAKSKIRTRPLISHELPLSETVKAFDLQINHPAERLKIMLHP